MARPKTQLTTASVTAFLNGIKDEQVRQDCRAIAAIMKDTTQASVRMWGPSIVGFGTYRCVYANGREAEWMLTAFSPRKKNITLYIGGWFSGYEAMRAKLGPSAGSKGWIYIKRLADVDVPALKKLVAASVKHVRQTEPQS